MAIPVELHEHTKKRLMSKLSVNLETGCWEWTDRLQENGYGKLMHVGGRRGRHEWAHRAAYELFVGPIPDGLVLDHLCRNTACANPKHLEAVTHKTNCLRGASPAVRAGLANECTKGHQLSPANTYVQPKSGRRTCRICKKNRRRRNYYGKKYAARELDA